MPPKDHNASGVNAPPTADVKINRVFTAQATLTMKPGVGGKVDAPGAQPVTLMYPFSGGEHLAPAVKTAAQALADGRLDLAEAKLRAHLDHNPNDVFALRLFGEIATRVGKLDIAEDLFLDALSIDPTYLDARYNLAVLFSNRGKHAEALAETRHLRRARPDEPLYRAHEAGVRTSIGDYVESLKLYEDLFAEGHSGPRLLISYGNLLRTLGRTDEGAQVFRRLATSGHPEDKPLLGEVWWNLTNLKTQALEASDRRAMQYALQDPAASETSRVHLHYALAAALEAAGEDAAAFGHYEAGGAIRRRTSKYDAEKNSEQVRSAMDALTPSLFAAHRGHGCIAADPIFVLGLPRVGSTLVDQILSSHPKVEGTMELPDLAALALKSGGWSYDGYLHALGRFTAGDLRSWGDAYISRTRLYRKTEQALFVDKMPQNWLYAGFIKLILPNAKIIDVRRHPLSSGVAAFRQLFSKGHNYSYDFADFGRYYADYVAFMDHIDAVVPDAVHRVIYEDLIEDTEGEVRRLLDYCGLAFDPACLDFHENRRPIRTPSAEQVRRPISREGLDRWRSWEPRLDPLKAALGATLETWRGRARLV